jgi:hypothetical protein
MDLKKIKALLADYYEGLTSKEEESFLREFFIRGEVPPEMEADRLLFMSLKESVEDILPDRQFDEKLFTAIEQQDRQNRVNARKNSPTRRMFITVSGIAAGILILLGSYFLLVERQMQEGLLAGDEYTVEETLLAYEEARNALIMVSQVMNRGTAPLEPLSKMETATRQLNVIGKFYEGTSELRPLSKFDETVTSLGRD